MTDSARVIYLPSAGTQTSFRDFLLMAALSEKTVTIYTRMVDRAILWLGDHGADLADCSAADLVAWASTLPAQPRHAARHGLLFSTTSAGLGDPRTRPAPSGSLLSPDTCRRHCQ